MNMRLESIVNDHYDALNSNDKMIVKQILVFQKEYKDLSCEQLANACHISRATLLRICRKIGLNSFSELKYLLNMESFDEENSQTDFHQICEDYHLLIDNLKKISFDDICQKIYKAETIYVYGTGNEQKNLAQELKQIFLSAGKCIIDLFDYGEIEFMKDSFQETDLFIIISLSGETKEGVDILNSISTSSIQTLSITRLQNNTIASLCQDNLYVATQKLQGIQDTSYELVAVFYVLLDLLFMHYLNYIRGNKL